MASSYMLKNLDNDDLAAFDAARQKARDEGRTMRWVILELLKGWAKGTYMLGAYKR